MASILKAIARTAYESRPHGTYKSKMWEEQCFVNFPILYLASIYLHDHAQEHGCTTFLFATRDCCHWYKIFTKLYPDADVHYFHCSRNMFENAANNNAYREYVRSLVKDVKKTIFIDVHGTGRRMFKYFETEFGEVPYCLLLSATHKNYSRFPSDTYKYYKEGRFINLIFDARGSPIEMLNYDLVGTLQNYLPEIGPVRAPLEYEAEIIRPYHNCVNELLKGVEPIKTSLDRKELLQRINQLYRPIQDDKPIISKWVDHLGNHEKDLAVEAKILDQFSFEEILSRDTIHGLIWSGLYDDRACVVKMIKLTSGNLQTKLENEKAPYHHQELVEKKPMTPEQFKREVEAMTLLSEAQASLVPKVYGHCVEDKKFDVHYGFIIMERVDGTVKDILLKRSLTKWEIKLVEDIINRTHDVVVHGDMKPSNIGVNLNKKGEIKECFILDCQKVQEKEKLSHRDFDHQKEKDWDTFFKHVKENASKRITTS